MKFLSASVLLVLACGFGYRAKAPAGPGPGTSNIQIAREAGRVTITFTGRLESAESVAGPWTEIPNATSPFTEELKQNQKFYRIGDAGPRSIFSDRSVVALTVTGPFQKHFELAFAGVPDGIFPPVREKPYFDGTLRAGDFELPVTLRVRGNSSLQECPFPKLKFKVAGRDRPGTPFFDAREVKIGTHCAEGGEGNIGRLRDERAAFREALTYEAMELLGFVTPRIRRARIEYHDTTATNEATETGWQLTRNAVILDDIEVVAERMGGRALGDEEIANLKDAGFDEQLITDLKFFHALVGNWDYGLSTSGEGFWNTDVIELPDERLVPVAGDFDLAGWVTGQVRLLAPPDYLPGLPDVDRQARFSLEQIRQEVSTPVFDAAKNRFTAQREAINAQIAAAQLDEPGRTNALRHTTAFFDALNAAGQ